MKYDIARAWKDATYRQSLSAEQLDTLPANPAGELSDHDLASVSGAGGGGLPGGFGGGAPVGSGAGAPGGGPIGGPIAVPPSAPPVTGVTGVNSLSSFFSYTRNESATLILCETNIFSVAIPVIPILSPTTQTCINR